MTITKKNISTAALFLAIALGFSAFAQAQESNIAPVDPSKLSAEEKVKYDLLNVDERASFFARDKKVREFADSEFKYFIKYLEELQNGRVGLMGPYIVTTPDDLKKSSELIEQLTDEKTHEQAVKKLVEMGVRASRNLFLALNSKDQAKSFAAKVVLERIARKYQPEIKKITDKFSDNDYRVRDQASKEVVKFGSAAVMILKKLAKSKDLEVAQRASEALYVIQKSELPSIARQWGDADLVEAMQDELKIFSRKLEQKRKNTQNASENVRSLRQKMVAKKRELASLKDKRKTIVRNSADKEKDAKLIAINKEISELQVEIDDIIDNQLPAMQKLVKKRWKIIRQIRNIKRKIYSMERVLNNLPKANSRSDRKLRVLRKL